MTLTDAMIWAYTAEAGDYLITYADAIDAAVADGMDREEAESREERSSRCGFADDELHAIGQTLRVRDLRLDTDDRGLLAAHVR